MPEKAARANEAAEKPLACAAVAMSGTMAQHYEANPLVAADAKWEEIYRFEPGDSAMIEGMNFTDLNFSGPLMWVALIAMGVFSMGTPTVFVAAYPSVLVKPELMSVGMGVLLLVQSLGQFLGTVVSSTLLGLAIDQWMLCGGATMALGLTGTACVALCKFR